MLLSFKIVIEIRYYYFLSIFLCLTFNIKYIHVTLYENGKWYEFFFFYSIEKALLNIVSMFRVESFILGERNSSKILCRQVSASILF